MEHFDKKIYDKQIGKGNIKDALGTIALAITKLSTDLCAIKAHLNIPVQAIETKIITPREIVETMKAKAQILEPVKNDIAKVEKEVEVIADDVMVDVEALMKDVQKEADDLINTTKDIIKPSKKK